MSETTTTPAFSVSVGQTVHYHPGKEDIRDKSFTDHPNVRQQCELGLPMAAIVTRVWNEQGTVNLIVLPDHGEPRHLGSVSPDPAGQKVAGTYSV